MENNDTVWELVCIGASVAANCTACLRYHVRKAQERGVDEEMIYRAIKSGEAVRNGAASRIEKATLKLTTSSVSDNSARDVPGCGCL